MLIDIPDNTTLTMTAAEYAAKLDMAKQAETTALQQELEALKAERAAMVDALNIDATDNPAVAVTALGTERDNLKRERDNEKRIKEGLEKLLDDIEELVGRFQDDTLASVRELVKDHADLKRAYDVLSDDSGSLLAENKRLSQRLEALEGKPPTVPAEPPVQPGDTVPVITPTDPVTVPSVKLPAPTISAAVVDNMYGIFISDGMASGNRRDAWLTEVIDFIIDAKVFNTVFMYANMDELRRWQTQGKNPAQQLRLNKIAWVFDTWNTVPAAYHREAAFNAEALGAVAFQIDDAHRWIAKDETPAEKQKLTDCINMVKGLRSGSNLPLIASYGGTTNVTQHTGLMDAIARQCYINGENPKLVKGYLDGITQIANLGVYRPDKDSPITTVTEVNGAFHAFLDSQCKAAVWYGIDDLTDLRRYPAQWKELIVAGKEYWFQRGIRL